MLREGTNKPQASGIDLTRRKESTQVGVDTSATPNPLNNDDALTTITPLKTLLNSDSHNCGDYFNGRLEDLTLNPIGRPQTFHGSISPENLQPPNDASLSPLKTNSSSVVHVDMKLPSVPELLEDISSQGRQIRMRPEGSPEKRTLPGVESFDHGAMSEKVLAVAAKWQNDMSMLSHEERKTCLAFFCPIASDMKLEKTQDTSNLEEDRCGERVGGRAETIHERIEVPKQEGFMCETCRKFFSQPSALKYISHYPSIPPLLTHT